MEELAGNRPFFVVKREQDTEALILVGDVTQVRDLDAIPRGDGVTGAEGDRFDVVAALPFAQARERGYAVHDDGLPIACLVPDTLARVSMQRLLDALPSQGVQLDGGAFDVNDEAYEAMVQRVITEEIGEGEGANFVIHRTYEADIRDFSHEKALSFFRSLLTDERGAYWTFCFFDGARYLIGATPERLISSHHGLVKMNPISGTFRKSEHDAATARAALLAFLQDRKEIFELFMVVDEELKVIADLCTEGGQIVGPLLKEMSKIVHSEYLLAGHSDADPIALLRASMWAATLTGSPVENAFRVIHRHEPSDRRFYGSSLALLGRDITGQESLDSQIMIRTAEIDAATGHLRLPVGATLVRDSSPEAEMRETRAKASGLMAALGVGDGGAPTYYLTEALNDDEVKLRLNERNFHLSRFWMEEQDHGTTRVPELLGRTVAIIDNEDAFTSMLAHVLRVMGLEVEVERWESYVSSSADIVIIGPGPGDPGDLADAKMARVTALTQELIDADRPFMAVCLGHQVLAGLLGFSLEKKDITFQGTQEQIDFFGAPQRVGFYNTFVARGEPVEGVATGLEISRDAQAPGDVHALRAEWFHSYQFHAESILTTNGDTILRDSLRALLRV